MFHLLDQFFKGQLVDDEHDVHKNIQGICKKYQICFICSVFPSFQFKRRTASCRFYYLKSYVNICLIDDLPTDDFVIVN